MSRGSEAVKEWRRKTKERMTLAMGGKCSICEYSKSHSALEFHHLDSDEKDFGFGSMRANPKSWIKIVEELRKCVLLCANCHREVHDGTTTVPDDYPKFNEKYADYRDLERESKKEPCPVCGNNKPTNLITCSRSCAGRNRGKANWKEYDLIELTKTMSLAKIGAMIGVSGAAVSKRLKKITS